jgi:hypothetical protein
VTSKKILGDVLTYFGVVESNGRGMLHLHAFVWLRGNVDFLNLREKVHDGPAFEMIEYLDSIIYEWVRGVQVASSLLQLPTYYTPPRERYRVNLHYLRRRI